MLISVYTSYGGGHSLAFSSLEVGRMKSRLQGFKASPHVVLLHFERKADKHLGVVKLFVWGFFPYCGPQI